MSKLIDYYPETLRDVHDLILEIAGEHATPDQIALRITEWLRHTWGGRTLTRQWWEFARKPESDADTLPLPYVASGELATVTSARGRELRLAAWQIIIAAQPSPGPCRLANAVAAGIELEWSRTSIYIPKGHSAERVLRNQQIWRSFSGLASIGQVIATSGLSQSSIYTINRRIRKEKDLFEQPSLFSLP